jgi:hypothetical protein
MNATSRVLDTDVCLLLPMWEYFFNPQMFQHKDNLYRINSHSATPRSCATQLFLLKKPHRWAPCWGSWTHLCTNLLWGQPQVLQYTQEAAHLVRRRKVKYPVATALVHFPAGKLLHEQKTSGLITRRPTSDGLLEIYCQINGYSDGLLGCLWVWNWPVTPILCQKLRMVEICPQGHTLNYFNNSTNTSIRNQSHACSLHVSAYKQAIFRCYPTIL